MMNLGIELLILVSLLAAVWLLWTGQSVAYHDGVVDGYGFAKEPWNPGYRLAGKHLTETMTHRWPEVVVEYEEESRWA